MNINNYKKFLELIQTIIFSITDALDEGRLSPYDKAELIKALKGILSELENEQFETEKLKEKLLKIYEIATKYNIFLEDDERDYTNLYLDKKKRKKVEVIIDSTLEGIHNEKIKNTIIAFTEDLINEVNTVDEGDFQDK